MSARLAQSVEHQTLNLRVVGSSPTLGEAFIRYLLPFIQRYVVNVVTNSIELDDKATNHSLKTWAVLKFLKFSKSPRRDLNSRPLVYKTSALTTELRRRNIRTGMQHHTRSL